MAATSTEAARIQSLDVIRGVAVMGILSVNIVDFSMIQAAYLSPGFQGRPDDASLLVWALNMLVVDGKFRTLFSALFGASMLLVIDRAQERGGSGWPVHWRRMAVLFLIGIVHMLFVWRGDILALYALTGLVAYRFRHTPIRRLLIWAVGLTLINVVLFAAIGATLWHQDAMAHGAHPTAQILRDWNANSSSFYPSADRIATDRDIFGGPWSGFVAYQAGHLGQFVMTVVLLLPDTLGLMLFGMAGYRAGFLTGEWNDRRYRRVAAWGIGLGLAGFGALVAADLASSFYIPVMLAGVMSFATPFRLAMAMGYAALMILASRRMGPVARRFAAVGRAAFTNYLGTSVVCTAVFYGWGLGLYGQLTRAEAWLVVPLVWLLMLAWSKPWLDRFHYGPLEWVWRSLARGRAQPMRRQPPPSVNFAA